MDGEVKSERIECDDIYIREKVSQVSEVMSVEKKSN